MAVDIPAPLSQVDEPTEELFKEEKEALKKQKGKGGGVQPQKPKTTLKSHFGYWVFWVLIGYF